MASATEVAPRRWLPVNADGHAPSGDGAVSYRSGDLEILDLAELSRRVEKAGQPSWLVEPLWPADAYGVLGAEDKAGKTWALLDLAVSVASGSTWFGHFACPIGPALLFLGEGGARSVERRLRAVANGRDIDLEELEGLLRVSLRVPRLNNRGHLKELMAELGDHPPRMMGLDPLYLAAPGGKSADLSAMGEMLFEVQQVAQAAGTALVVVTHWNQTGQGTGAKRFTGAGPSAWGRILGSASVERRARDSDGASNVLLRWEFTGGEIGDTAFRVRRKVRAEDPLDLASPLTYAAEVTDERASDEPDQLSPSQRRVLAALDGSTDLAPLTVKVIGDRVADDGQGSPLTARTIQRALKELGTMGLADGEPGDNNTAGRWWGSEP